MATRTTKPKSGGKQVETLTHDEAKRRNIPTAEFETVMREEEKSPIRLAYERRNRDLDPQLVWRGKDEQDWSDLVVHAPPLYIQEKVHPKVLIDDLLRQSRERADRDPPEAPDLFADFNGLPDREAATEFYQHDANWSNRMILGDSLQVMASLAEREGLRGQVQCIYIDPPYGIKFNSNFQWSTTSRDVKDGKADHITREPEQVKAFRDTWRDGIHSYLTYLRDRLTVARDLLADSGSIFVQIGDENVHRVRLLMDEVFGEDNFQNVIYFSTTGGLATSGLSRIGDYVVWYTKNAKDRKYRQLYVDKKGADEEGSAYKNIQIDVGVRRRLSSYELSDAPASLPTGRIFRISDLCGQGASAEQTPFTFQGKEYNPTKNSHWKPNYPNGLRRAANAERIYSTGKTLNYVRFYDDYPVSPLSNVWTDTGHSGFAYDKLYVVQTSVNVVERCILMTTDPGDLVLDPTCGSGTTAYVAEQWGRRWITIDTSRVALALARARIMGARYSYYVLADTPEGQRKEAEVTRTAPSEAPTHGDIRHGFVYERVPHITLKSIANNAEIDVIWEKWQEILEPLLRELCALVVKNDHKDTKGTKTLEEWEVPREAPEDWPVAAKAIHAEFWDARIQRQKEIDASIAAKAEFEYLYDKPYVDNSRIRVAGPFTVESLSPHRVLAVDQDDELIPASAGDGARETGPGYRYHGPVPESDFADVILENLKTSGVQQAHKEDKIDFTAITGWPGEYICAEGRFSEERSADSGQSPATGHQPPTTEKRAGIFIGPEFGTVARPDLVAAAREAADAGFDVLIACAFNYDAHSAEFEKLGRIPVLKARMNADLHMADELKNTGKGNLFVIFGEPDIEVAGGQWLVTGSGRMVIAHERLAKLSGLGGLEEINRLGGSDLPRLKRLAAGREVRPDQPGTQGGGIGAGEHRGRRGTAGDGGVSAVSGDREGLVGGGGDAAAGGGAPGVSSGGDASRPGGADGGGRPHALRPDEVAAIEALTKADFPLSLTTGHWTQVTIHGVDVFHPQTGEIDSSGPDGIACWFIDTDYNEESFFVRHAYFLGASDPYKALKTTLKAEIDEQAWTSLYSDTSRPFNKPTSGRIAVKVINHLGDEVMKVFGVG